MNSAEENPDGFIPPHGNYEELLSYQKAEEGLSGAPKSAWHTRGIEANIKFAQAFPERWSHRRPAL